MDIATYTLALQGRGHVKTGVPCQDKVYSVEDNGTTCLVLADGAGSASHSHFGAEATCKATARLLCSDFDVCYSSSDVANVQSEILSSILDALKEVSEEHNCRMSDLASTLLFVAVKDGNFLAGHLGDGILAFSRDQRLKAAKKPDNGEFANSTCFVTSANAAHRLQLFKGGLNEITGFVLMSDGTAESFYRRSTGTLSTVLNPLICSVHLKHKSMCDHEIRSFFEQAVLKNTSDDCSLAVMSLYEDDEVLFRSLSRKALRRLFFINNRHKKSCLLIDEYINIIMYSRISNNETSIARALSLTKRKVRRIIKKLQKYGFKNVLKNH